MTENCRVKMARFFDGTLLPFVALAFGLAAALAAFAGVDPRDQDLLAAQRRDGGVHRVGDPLAGDGLPGARPSANKQMSA